MSTHQERLHEKKYLISLLLLVVFINLVANIISEEVSVLVGNFIYIPVAGTLVYFSFLLIKTFGTSGKQAWRGLVCLVLQ